MKKMDLCHGLDYDPAEYGDAFRTIPICLRLLIMKLAIRFFAMTIVCAGLAAASVSSGTTPTLPDHLSATVSVSGPMLPIPSCGPNVPTCGGYLVSH